MTAPPDGDPFSDSNPQMSSMQWSSSLATELIGNNRFATQIVAAPGTVMLRDESALVENRDAAPTRGASVT
jgi:hypothetical protein